MGLVFKIFAVTQQQEKVFHWFCGCQLARRMIQMGLRCEDQNEAWGVGKVFGHRILSVANAVFYKYCMKHHVFILQ
jgi:hypothetical protein